MRICLVAPSRFPIREPFEGGMEAHTAMLAEQLIRRGHSVTLFAAPGSDPRLGVEELPVPVFGTGAGGRRDLGATPEELMQEHYAYLGLMLQLARTGADRFDVVHNNSLHHVPVELAELLPVPVVTTLHTPPYPWLEWAMAVSAAGAGAGAVSGAGPRAGKGGRFVAVSRHTARAWAHATPTDVVLNGVDTDRWAMGGGGEGAVWTGRLVPEKAPHLAIAAATSAGLRIDLAGPTPDGAYFAREIEPLLGERVRYVGHLATDALVRLVGRAAVAIVSPVWDEPYGLVAAEAMSCGTPVAAFRRGALPEIVVDGVGAFADPDDVGGLATAVKEAAGLDRRHVRDHARRWLGIDRMTASYEQVYRRAQAEHGS